MFRFNLNVCDSHKILKRNLNFNFYQKLKRTPLQIGSRQKSAHWYVETAYITRRQKTCLSSSYLVMESSRKTLRHILIRSLNHNKVLSVNASVLLRVFLPQHRKAQKSILYRRFQGHPRTVFLKIRWKHFTCSVILGELESFQNYKGFRIIFPKILGVIQHFTKVRIFLIPLSITFWNPKILVFLFLRKIV